MHVVKDNCTTEELRCTPVGVAECEGSINGTRCICPLQYELERDGTTCKGIHDNLTIASALLEDKPLSTEGILKVP